MSIFESLGHGCQKQREQVSPQDAMQQLKDHPAATLKQAGLSIPDGMTDPSQILQHLMQSGQISNPRLQMAQRMMGMLGRK